MSAQQEATGGNSKAVWRLKSQQSSRTIVDRLGAFSILYVECGTE